MFFLLLLALNASFGRPADGCEPYDKYSVEANQHADNNCLITITDNQQNSSFDWGNVQSCYSEHYHFAEYHHPNLYLIKRFDTSQPNWNDEVWMISQSNSNLIAKGKGIDFRVNNSQSLIAYSGSDERELLIKNLHDNSIKKITAPDDADGIALIQWASNADILWGSFLAGPSIDRFFKYDYSKNTLEQFSLPENFEDEYAINPDLGLMLYSSYPFMVDAATEAVFANSATEVSLFLYDFSNQTANVVATAGAHAFMPKWICQDYYEYSSPKSNKRVSVKYDK